MTSGTSTTGTIQPQTFVLSGCQPNYRLPPLAFAAYYTQDLQGEIEEGTNATAGSFFTGLFEL